MDDDFELGLGTLAKQLEMGIILERGLLPATPEEKAGVLKLDR